MLELRDDGAPQRIVFTGLFSRFRHRLAICLKKLLILRKPGDPGALRAFDQNLDGSIRQFQQLQDSSDRPDLEYIVRGRIVVARMLLRNEQNLLIVIHDVFEGANGLLATDEERNDHMGKHDDVA